MALFLLYWGKRESILPFRFTAFGRNRLGWCVVFWLNFKILETCYCCRQRYVKHQMARETDKAIMFIDAAIIFNFLKIIFLPNK